MKQAQLWLSSIAIAALMASASAQVWDETANGGGDAGDLPSTAQVVAGNPNNPLTRITGRMATGGEVDMFAILICDPANFYAHTGSTSETNYDTKLVLFDSQGRPLWMNDDRPSEAAITSLPPNGVGSLSFLYWRRRERRFLPQQRCAEHRRLRYLGAAWSWTVLPGDRALAAQPTRRDTRHLPRRLSL